MEAELRANLAELAKRYGAAKDLNVATVAQRALGDWRFFDRLDEKETASFTVRKYDAALAWFAAHWPDNAEWPEGLLRPGQEAAA